MTRPRPALAPLTLAVLATLSAHAPAQVVIYDKLTGATSSYSWQAIGGACLTAATYDSASTSSIPGCASLPYYTGKGSTHVGGVSGTLPDASGYGALRLTNGTKSSLSDANGNYQAGAVVSNFTFPSNAGVNVTFSTVTYGGNGGNTSGADGISFFLLDADKATHLTQVGSVGGSLGYSCSHSLDHVNSDGSSGGLDGVVGAYIGLGIDEFGNFVNGGDNAPGQGFTPGAISLRGAGGVNWANLNAKWPQYYPSALSSTGGSSSNPTARDKAVASTCKTGALWDYSKTTPTQVSPTPSGFLDYPLLSTSTLPSTQPIWSQQNVANPVRGSATPITYKLSITQDGLLSLYYSYGGGSAVKVMTDKSITANNGALPTNFRFGFAASTGGSSNVHEITCFKATSVTGTSSSVSLNAQQSSRVQTGSQVYLSYFHPENNWGQLISYGLVYDSSTDLVSLASTAHWDGNCGLTGGSCAATGTSATLLGWSARTLLTHSGTGGVPFRWAKLTSTQQGSLTAGDTTATNDRLQYLRGNRSLELDSSGSGTYRARTGVLGEIRGSSPSWVGPPSSAYSGKWSDAIHASSTAPESGYATFKSTYASRMNVVYVGANDGFLHGFRTGAYDSSGKYSTTIHANDGREVIGYMPAQVVSSIHSTTTALDYAAPSYSQNTYVDAPPSSGDLYYKGAWRTWLVGGLGSGGNPSGVINNKTSTATGTVFALDVTDPSQFSEDNAASTVVGEWSSSNLSCANKTGCGSDLGNTYGTPLIRRLHNGQWAILYGNGRNSANGVAGLFVTTFDPTTGAATTYFLSTGYGASQDPAAGSAKNGIDYISSADLDGDHITDYVYAADQFGYVWRFDLTDTRPSQWAVKSTPVATTGGRPITTRLTVSSVASSSGSPRVMLGFGTGRMRPQNTATAAVYESGTQYLMGVWDADMGPWNALGSAQMAALSSTSQVSTTDLRTQTITSYAVTNGSISGYRTVSSNTVCWKGSTTCTTSNDLGWKIALPGTNEQVIYNPVLYGEQFVVNTTIPAVNQAMTCQSETASGFTMAVRADTGAPSTTSFFKSATNAYSAANGDIVAGLGLSGVGTPTFVTTNGKTVLVQQNVEGTGTTIEVNPGLYGTGRRLNWIRLR